MIFTPASIDQILKGKKTQTRRPVKDTHAFCHDVGDQSEVYEVWGEYATRGPRDIWARGRTYAIQPGRGKKQIGRFKLNRIRREHLGDISPEDAMAEGLMVVAPASKGNWGIYRYGRDPEKGHDIMWSAPSITEAYIEMYQSMHPKAKREDLIWVLEFELDPVTGVIVPGVGS